MAGPIVAETGLAARAGIPRQREQQQRHKEQERSHGPMDTGDVPPQQDRSSPFPPNSGCVASATSRPGHTPHPKAPIPVGRQWHPASTNLSTSLPTPIASPPFHPQFPPETSPTYHLENGHPVRYSGRVFMFRRCARSHSHKKGRGSRCAMPNLQPPPVAKCRTPSAH